MELRIQHRGHALQEARAWALKEIAQSVTIKRARRKVLLRKTGNYQLTAAKGQQQEVMGHYILAGDVQVLEISRMEEDTKELKCGEGLVWRQWGTGECR